MAELGLGEREVAVIDEAAGDHVAYGVRANTSLQPGGDAEPLEDAADGFGAHRPTVAVFVDRGEVDEDVIVIRPNDRIEPIAPLPHQIGCGIGILDCTAACLAADNGAAVRQIDITPDGVGRLAAPTAGIAEKSKQRRVAGDCRMHRLL